MSITVTGEKRGEGPDTKTLARLGVDEVEDPVHDERPDTKTLVRLGMELEERGSDAPVTKSTPPPVGEVVELRFKGVREPVAVRAERSASGLQLRHPLPFLELGSVVGIEGTEEGAPQHGRVRSVRIEQGAGGSRVPQLSVEVSFSETPIAVEAPRVDPPAPREARQVRRWPMLGLGIVIGVACTVGGTLLWPQQATKASAALHVAPAKVAPVVRVLASPKQVAARPPSAPAADAIDEVMPAIDAEEPADEAEENQAFENAAAQVMAGVDATEVLIPMRGDATEQRTYELSTPGLAVTLPHAQALGPLGNHRIVRGLVRRVWLIPLEGGGTQVRVITRRPALRWNVSYDDAGLHIALAH